MKKTNSINIPRGNGATRRKIIMKKIIWWQLFLFSLALPIIKWVVSLITFFYAIRVIYFWSEPGLNHIFIFLFSFLILSFLTYFEFEIKQKL